MGSFKKHNYRKNFHFAKPRPKHQPKKDYSSIEKTITLPPLRNIRPEQDVYPELELEKFNESNPQMSDDLKKTAVTLRTQLRREFQTYETSEHEFNFPESKFREVAPGGKNEITYEQKNIVEDEDTFKDRLSNEQVEQIRQKGEFDVRSNHEYITQPYVWKINDTIFKGARAVRENWFDLLSVVYAIWDSAGSCITEVIPEQFHLIAKIPKRLFSLIFGRKAMQTVLHVDYQKEIAKDFWNEVMSVHYVECKEWGTELYQYFQVEFKADAEIPIESKPDSLDYKQKFEMQEKQRKEYAARKQKSAEKMEKIRELTYEFDYNWNKSRKKVLKEISQQNSSSQSPRLEESELLIKPQSQEKQSEQQLLQKFNEAKFSYYLSFLEEKLPPLDVPKGVIEALVTVLTLFQAVNVQQRRFDRGISQARTQIENQLKEEHQIRYRYYPWRQQRTNERLKPITERLRKQFLERVFEVELASLITERQKNVGKLWLDYCENYNSRVEAKKKEKREIVAPKRIFYSTYLLLPPFQVIESENYGRKSYSLLRELRMQVETNTNFWKCRLYFMRLKCWTINCVIFLIHSCWKGPFGIRCLFGIADFNYNQSVDYNTGVVTHLKRKTFLGAFGRVLKGIRKSRQHFEDLPDRGLFGKNFSRVFNYLECYVFRFLFVGVLLTLILYPVAIVASSAVMAALVVTFWAWMPLLFLATYLFNILVYQFESSQVVPGFFQRSFPLPVLALSLVFHLVAIVAIFVFAVVLCPVGMLLVLLYTVVTSALRSLSDCIMLFFIRNLGRSPSRNSAVARKISGPGMSKQYYMSIGEEDVYVLIQAEMQRFYMDHLSRLTNERINRPVNDYNKTMTALIQPYDPNFSPSGLSLNNSQNVVLKTVQALRKNFNDQYLHYVARFPRRPRNTRFTQDEIDKYFSNTIQIVRNFVDKRGIKDFVYEEFEILEDNEELTRKIWERVFGCGEEIFEPLEKIDQRFKLEDQHAAESASSNLKMQKSVHSVVEALEGEVDLKATHAKITPYRHSLINQEYNFSGAIEVFSHINANQGSCVSFNTHDPKLALGLHLDIAELIKYENAIYASDRKKYEHAEEAE